MKLTLPKKQDAMQKYGWKPLCHERLLTIRIKYLYGLPISENSQMVKWNLSKSFAEGHIRTRGTHYVRNAGIHLAGFIIQSDIKLTCSLVLHLNNLKLHVKHRQWKPISGHTKKIHYTFSGLTFNPRFVLTSFQKEKDSQFGLIEAYGKKPEIAFF